MTPKRAATVFVCCALWGPSARAQTFGQFQIKAEGNVVRPDGGEQISVFFSSGTLEIGKTTPSGIGKLSSSGCGV
jgi:hypothetical protein